jgi:heavy metal sensor kinase
VRLTAAFALAMAIVLALAAFFAYTHVRSDLDSAIDDGLRARSAAVAALVSQSDTGLSQAQGPGAEQNFAQVLTPGGGVLDASREAASPALTRKQIDAALRGSVMLNRAGVLGIDGEARIMATPIHAQDRRLVVVVGSAIDDRNQALAELRQAFLIGAPVGVLLAAGIGYLLASAALSPVERMRRRAEKITLAHGEERLPLAPASDEIRRLGETLNAMLDRLDKSFSRERRFVADASHELRTPITVLKSELEVALRTSELPTRELEALRSALEEVERLARLSDDLLVLARADEGKLPVRRESLELGQLLERAARPFARRADELGRRIEVETDEGLRAPLDPLRMEQALHNLIDNALRYGDGPIRVSAHAWNGALTLAVTDEGPGFDAAERDLAFERFTRGAEERGGHGSGLGLAIVRAIAEAHGGSAEIAAGAIQAGTEVRVVLPLGDGPMAESSA